MSPQNLDRDLPPIADELLSECPRFRILVLGKSGVGKTSLIKNVLKIESIQASNLISGVSDVNEELTSPANDRIVLHDSPGFEPGEVENYDTITEFINGRVSQSHIKNRLHAIWYCIQIPHAGDRIFETGDEYFLKLKYRIPTIVVFTKYDRLLDHTRFTSNADELNDESPEVVSSISEEKANAEFQNTCMDVLKRYNTELEWAKVSIMSGYEDTCTALVDQTSNLVLAANRGWYLSADTQRMHAEWKIIFISVRIKSGMEKYWLDVASSTHFDRHPLRQCLRRILLDMLQIWNFNDSDKILMGTEFEAMVFRLVQDLGDPGSEGPSPSFRQGKTTAIRETLDGSVSPGPPDNGGWLLGTYERGTPAPRHLIMLMGFIVDLTMMLERLFWTMFRKDVQSVTIEHVQEVFNKYIISHERTKIHREITEYVKIRDPRAPNEAYEEVERLIGAHRVVPEYSIIISSSITSSADGTGSYPAAEHREKRSRYYTPFLSLFTRRHGVPKKQRRNPPSPEAIDPADRDRRLLLDGEQPAGPKPDALLAPHPHRKHPEEEILDAPRPRQATSSSVQLARQGTRSTPPLVPTRGKPSPETATELVPRQESWHPEIQDHEIQKVASMSDRGGFGECYRGIFLGSQEVAMKCLRARPQRGSNTNVSLEEKMNEMVGREVYVWRKLRHPNILPLIGLCTLDSVTYMVSPWMANGNAFDYVRRNPGADRLDLLAQAADGFKFLHDSNPTIVHGDIRGPNVLISASGTVCIADFGLSHVVEEASKFSYSTSWKRAGSYAWMAPELLGDDPSPRSTETDVFSFGRMIVELVTGEQPFFYLPSMASVLIAVVNGKTPRKPEPGSITCEFSEELWALAEECYAVEANSRPHMSAVASRIRAIKPLHHIASVTC